MAVRSLAGIACCCVLIVSACGGGGSAESSAPPAHVAQNQSGALVAISPNSSDSGAAGFTLSVVGSNFSPGSQVMWNGSAVATTFLNSQLLTAPIAPSAVASAEPASVTVAGPAPGGNSSAMRFSVPCPIPASTTAASQARARVATYYFDGWSGPLINSHFNGLPLGPYQSRQPNSGWQDSTPCAVEQQLAVARNFGIDFFVFDWYFNAVANASGENLNSALEIMHALPDRHGMQFAILYVDAPPFLIAPAHWQAAVAEWVGYMRDPSYARINGLPALFILNVGEMEQLFGSSASVSSALAELRAAVQAKGLPGVYVVGGFGIPSGTMGQDSLGPGFSIAQQDGYDAVALYNYPFAPPAVQGMLPFSTLAGAGQWTWNQALQHSALPFIPTVMAGWDPRPWNEQEPTTGSLMWYSRTPQEFASFAGDAIAWANANSALRPEPLPAAPLVLIEAWNEIGEGSHMLPTQGEGTSYGDALAAALTAP